MRRNIFLFFLSVRPLVTPLASRLSAQENGRRADEVVVISPFTVSADKDSGYYASSTMAGGRLNTSLRDVGSSIQIVTAEFMQDIGANNLDTLMQYLTSGETAGIQGNFVGYSAPGGDQTSSVESRANIGNTQRIRGLGNPDKTRNFFKTLIPLDSYNTERVEVNRGANSFLFGLGSPAGLVNTSLKAAVFKNMVETSFRVGEGGERPSSRLSLDLNRVLVKDTLALRVAAMDDDTEFRQNPTYYKDKRYYAAVTYRPRKYTTIRSHFEKVSTRADPADVLLPQENLSMFLNAPSGLARASVDVVDNARRLGNSEGAFNNIPTPDALRNLNAGNQAYFLIWDGMVATDRPASARVNGVRGGLLQMPTPPAYWNTLGTSRRPAVYYVKHGNYRDYKGVGYIQRGFTDLSTFDFTRNNLAGGNDFVARDFENFNISLEQLFLNGQAGVELAFDQQNFDSDNWVVFHAGAENIFFDINRTLLTPDPSGNGLTPMPNPNYGRPAVMTQSWNPIQKNHQRSQRFTGFVQHDFRRDLPSFWGKLLGRHRFTGLFDRVTSDDKNVQYRFASYTPAGTPDDLSTNAANVTTNYDRQLFELVYVGPPQPAAFSNPGFTLADFKIEPITANLKRMREGYSTPVTFWNVRTNTWDTTNLTGRWVPADSQSLSHTTVTSAALNYQGHIFDDIVVANVGWRQDQIRAKSRVNDAPVVGDTRSVDPADWNLASTPETKLTNHILGWGVVAHWPSKLLRKPDWFDLSLHYNNSENFVPSAGRQDHLGNALPMPTGISKDYGFTLSLFRNKLVARVNWFEGALANTGDYWRQVNGIVADAVNAYGNLQREIIQLDKNGDRKIDAGAADSQFYNDQLLERDYGARDFLKANLDPRALALQHFNQAADGSYSSSWTGALTTDLNDNASRGMEIEITANPTPTWRIALSLSKVETTLTNIAPRLTQFISTVTVPYLKQFGDLVYANPARFDGQTARDFMNEKLFSFYADKAAEGTPANEQRKWTCSVVSNYGFTAGWLKGVTVGGAIRWQDKYAYGYRLATLNGLTIPDVRSPYWGEPECNIDAWFGYGRRIWEKKVDWKIQLNVRNLNNWSSNHVSTIRVQPDGEAARARFDPPREIFLTNTFKF